MIGALPPKQQEKVQCDFEISPLATFEELITTHSPEYVKNFMSGNITDVEIRNVGFPWSPSGVNRALSSVGGTVAAACAVCDVIQGRRQQHGEENNSVTNSRSPLTWSAHVAGGTHHAFHDRGEGFCVFSDIAVAANVILERYPDIVKRILIIDLDVHQGNGNAVLFQGRDDVMTFSMHCKKNFFSEKQSSDLDVELPEHCTDQTYLSTLSHWLKRINEEGGEYDVVFYQAGVDIIADDRLGRMALTSEGVLKRNQLIYNWAGGIPLVITMGGGYPKKNWEPILDAHSNVYFSAFQYLAGAM
jgi:acetoin utilization deacetylase AcuC-like enzyme